MEAQISQPHKSSEPHKLHKNVKFQVKTDKLKQKLQKSRQIKALTFKIAWINGNLRTWGMKMDFLKKKK